MRRRPAERIRTPDLKFFEDSDSRFQNPEGGRENSGFEILGFHFEIAERPGHEETQSQEI